MRWNCPHCSISLAVSDEKIGPGWSFSRCYKCGGFALVRRTEINLIKVDKAPNGEPVLLPEAAEDPAMMMSQAATQRLSKITENRPENKNGTAKIPPRFNYTKPEAAPIAPKMSPQPAAPPSLSQGLSSGLPILPDSHLDKPATSQRILPVAIGLAGALAIASGVYLYIQGQAIWEKARTSAAQNAQNPKDVPPVAPLPPVVQAEPVQTPPMLATPPTEVRDVVHDDAAAPTPQNPNVVIRIRANNVKLHTGPGMNFPVIGIANNEIQYIVTDWSDRWFKIKADSGHISTKTSQDTAWVRNDLVQLVPGENLLNAP